MTRSPEILSRAQDAAARLIIFPPAGGTVLRFRELCGYLPKDVECLGIEYAGHGARWAEQLEISVERLAVAAFAQIKRDLPIVLFGHSLGAFVAYAVSRELENQGMPPYRLIVAGQRAPGTPSRHELIHQLDDARLLNRLAALGGTPIEALASADLMEIVLPIFRADATAAETYTPEFQAPITSDIVSYGGLCDPFANPEEIEAWRRFTSGSHQSRMFEGGHFFPFEHPADVAQSIILDLC